MMSNFRRLTFKFALLMPSVDPIMPDCVVDVFLVAESKCGPVDLFVLETIGTGDEEQGGVLCMQNKEVQNSNGSMRTATRS